MTTYGWTWVAIVGAGAAMWAIKAVGHRVPEHALDNPRLVRIASLVTVSLLTALAILQTLTTGRSIEIDARVPALAVAAVLLWRKAPFIVVVAAAAGVAAALRALGWG
jgi:branched-subunit amino acid transport protein